MNRGLLVGLAAVAGLSIYLSMQSDDELQAPGKQGARSGQQRNTGQRDVASRDSSASVAAGAAGKSGNRADDKQDSKEAWVSSALIAGVNQWQARLVQADDNDKMIKLDQQAWGSMRPPPPPPPKVVYVEPPPPPPPVAPPFPHKWIGSFNDETVDPLVVSVSGPAPATSGVNIAKARPVQRAVVAGPSSTWVLKEGDVIEGQWRVDRIDNHTMLLTYLPLKLPQTVAMK